MDSPMMRYVTNSPHHRMGRLGLVTLCLMFSSWQVVLAQTNLKDYGVILVGGGSSIPGWGSTTERVKTVDIIPRYCHILNADMGQGWYQANHELWIEMPFSYIASDSDPQDSGDIGIFSANFLAALVFQPHRALNPYVSAGGGPVYVAADIEGVGSDLCGNYMAGAGIRLKASALRYFNVEARYHHVSNLNMADPNVPLNSLKIMLGMTIRF